MSIFRNPHYVLALLFLGCLMSYVDRTLIALLMNSIQKDLRLRDWQVGFLSGTSFALFYVGMGIPLSRLADRFHRVGLLAACLVVWSAMTSACGLAVNFVQLALARVGVALGEAGGYPSSLSLISDIYPPRRRSTVTAIFFSGTTAGALVAFGIGGRLNQLFGWRWTLMIAAVPGLILAAVLAVTVREPKRGAMDSPRAQNIDSSESTLTVARALFSNRTYRWIAFSAAVGNIQLFSFSSWMPVYAVRTFPIGTGLIGLGLGLAMGLGSGAIMIGMGFVSDRLSGRVQSAAMLLAAAGQIICIPLLWATLSSHNFPVFCFLYAFTYAATAWGGPLTIAASQAVVPANLRGTAAALMTMIATIFGLGLGPLFIGVVSDNLPFGAPDERLRIALTCGTAFSAANAVILLLGARRPKAAALAAAPSSG